MRIEKVDGKHTVENCFNNKLIRSFSFCLLYGYSVLCWLLYGSYKGDMIVRQFLKNRELLV